MNLPDWAWRRPEVRAALRDRDVGAVLRAAQQYTGASQSRISVAIGVLQGRVSEILHGSRTVVALASFERIAVGLAMPDDARMLLGLAPIHAEAPDGEYVDSIDSLGEMFDLALGGRLRRIHSESLA